MKQVAEFFNDGTEWSAGQQLERWCEENDYAIGSSQCDAPQGLMKGRKDWYVAKWRNLSKQDIEQLDGYVAWTGGGSRNGNCIVMLREICSSTS